MSRLDSGTSPRAATQRTLAKVAPRRARGRPRDRSLLEFLEAYALVLVLGVVVVFFSFYGPTASTFPTLANLNIVLGQQAVLAIIALAALIPLICGEFDLSVGAIAGLSSVFSAAALSTGVAIPLAFALAIGIGAVVGLVNAVIVTKIGVNSLIATLGTAAILAGMVQQKTGGLALVSNSPQSLTTFGSDTWFGVPRLTYVMVAIAFAVYYLLAMTPFGRYIHALGSNREAARLVGLRTDFVVGMTFVVSGILSGAAGALQVAHAGGANPKVGDSFTLAALAAAFLSTAVIKPGRYSVAGTLVAIFFLAAINAGLSLAGALPYVSSYVNGTALIVGVGLTVVLGRKRIAST